MRNLVKTVILQCITCYRFKAQATQQLRGELPSTRVQSSKPFLTTAVDYAGPISITLGPPRSKTLTKVTLLYLSALELRLFTLKYSQAYPQKHFLLSWDVSLHVEGNQVPFVQTMVPTFKVLRMNFMQSTKCFNPLHRRQQYRNSWPLKDGNGNSFHHMDLTSEDYGKQQWNAWSIISEVHLVLRLPLTRIYAYYLLR